MTPRISAERQLAAVLLLRAAANVALAAWVIVEEPSWGALFDGTARYALIDGTLGLLAASLLVRDATVQTPALVAGITATDGITRIVGALTLLALPGISEFPVTVMLLLGAAAAAMIALGCFAFGVWLGAVSPQPRSAPKPRDTSLDALAPMAFFSLVLGALLLVRPPVTEESLRAMATAAVIMLALVFGFAAGALMTESRRREARVHPRVPPMPTRQLQ